MSDASADPAGDIAAPDATTVEPVLYHAAITFVAGFTERLSQDAIAGASSRLVIASAGTSGSERGR